MTNEEIIRECIELVWDYEENHDGDDLLNFQNKELSTYTQHESVVATFNKYIQLEKENTKLKAENKQIIERERVVPEHYLCEMIEKCKELKAQNETILEDNDTLNKWVDELKAQNEKMKCCFNCKNVHYEWGEKVIEGVCHECSNYNKWEMKE